MKIEGGLKSIRIDIIHYNDAPSDIEKIHVVAISSSPEFSYEVDIGVINRDEGDWNFWGNLTPLSKAELLEIAKVLEKLDLIDEKREQKKGKVDGDSNRHHN